MGIKRWDGGKGLSLAGTLLALSRVAAGATSFCCLSWSKPGVSGMEKHISAFLSAVYLALPLGLQRL